MNACNQVVGVKISSFCSALFDCHLGPDDGIQPETNFASIIEQMEIDYRPQTFFIDSPLRAYTLEMNSNGEQNRVWVDIAPHQLLTIEELTSVEYTPTVNDQLTLDDYGHYWWLCFVKYILKRHEYVMKCLLAKKTICYIPCSSTDEICLYPVGQRGSKNLNKLQTIENLLENFSVPINIKLVPFPGVSDAYKDFSGHIQILGSYTKEFAVCAPLSSTNVSLVSLRTPLKFVAPSIPLTSTEIENQLSRCQIFVQSFDRQIRRIILSNQEQTPHRSRSKHQSANKNKNMKRSSSVLSNRSLRPEFGRSLSNEDRNTYNSLVHPLQQKSSTPRKRRHISHSSTPFTYDTGSNLTEELNSPSADGSILFDDKMEIFSFLNR